jgi:antitoxin VapB
MSLSIKNKEAHWLARQLAEATGESMTLAVCVAIRERLERVRRGSTAGLAERLLNIGRECAAHLKDAHKPIDHGESLYNEKGLPR